MSDYEPAAEDYPAFGRVVWRERTRRDEGMDADSAARKLDFLFGERENESAQGLTRDRPPPE